MRNNVVDGIKSAFPFLLVPNLNKGLSVCFGTHQTLLFLAPVCLNKLCVITSFSSIFISFFLARPRRADKDK